MLTWFIRHVPSNTFGLKWYQLFSSIFPEHYLSSFFPVSVRFEFPLLFWLILLQQSPECQQVIVLLLHIKQKPSQTVRMKWGDGMISRNKLFSFCLIMWGENNSSAKCASDQTAYQLFISWGSLRAREVCLGWRTESWWTGRAAGRDMEVEHCAWLSRSISAKTITRRQADHL